LLLSLGAPVGCITLDHGPIDPRDHVVVCRDAHPWRAAGIALGDAPLTAAASPVAARGGAWLSQSVSYRARARVSPRRYRTPGVRRAATRHLRVFRLPRPRAPLPPSHRSGVEAYARFTAALAPRSTREGLRIFPVCYEAVPRSRPGSNSPRPGVVLLSLHAQTRTGILGGMEAHRAAVAVTLSGVQQGALKACHPLVPGSAPVRHTWLREAFPLSGKPIRYHPRG